MLDEGNYLYPLPGEAVFSDFSLWQGDRELKGEPMDFFFSSRVRHTICGRDWSSDVCSSDLPISSLIFSLIVAGWTPLAGSMTRTSLMIFVTWASVKGLAWRNEGVGRTATRKSRVGFSIKQIGRASCRER